MTEVAESEGKLLIGTRRYSSWSLRGWLAVRLAGLKVEEEVVGLYTEAVPAWKRRAPAGKVPVLEHRGVTIWESLAIVEYCAELAPLWPAERAARATARAMSSEMHAGFAGLRSAMTMSLFRQAAGAGRTPEALADIARIDSLWNTALAAHGGPFLFGPEMGAADAMFAPVVCRFLTYRPEISAPAQAYCAAVRAHPLLQAWYAAAEREPTAWYLPQFEAPLSEGEGAG